MVRFSLTPRSQACCPCEYQYVMLIVSRVSSVSSCEPAVSTGGLCSESSPGSTVSEVPYWPRFTTDQQRGLSDLFFDDYYIRQVNVVNGGYTVMLAVVLSFCPSVRTQYLDANISKTV